MVGPGKYDDLATKAREDAEADGVILVVFRGNKGNGFSAQFLGGYMTHMIPHFLREVASQIENDTQRKGT